MPKRDRVAVNQELSQILAGSDASDLLGSVIRSDRRRSGRALPDIAEQDTMTGHAVSGQYDKQTSTQPDHKSRGQAGKSVSPVAVGQADTTAEHLREGTAKQEARGQPEGRAGDRLDGRVAEARRMAESPTTTVTLRIPRELNDWLDEYIHRAWPERVRKQDLVSEGLRLVFARRGRPGEPVLPTTLLPEEESP
jgi:hypothetical protein